MTRIFNDGNDVRSGFGHVEKIATRAVREFDSVDISFGTDNVGNVGTRGSCGSSEVEDFGARFDPDVVYST